MGDICFGERQLLYQEQTTQQTIHKIKMHYANISLEQPDHKHLKNIHTLVYKECVSGERIDLSSSLLS